MTTLSVTADNLYGIYVQSILALAQSIVVKFDQVAQATNLYVLQKTGYLVDPYDKTTWKYYQNISGEYHFSDTKMRVYSLDAEIIIDFDVATLAESPVTKAAYAYGTTLYNELLAQYPDQEMLILGILYPCDKQKAIDARDGTILAYPDFLVESQEITFLEELQSWVYSYMQRWIILGFTLTDDLYPATYLAQLYLNLVPAIYNLRLKACKTNRAHSFHVRQYLRSHGLLDVYLNQLTQKQALHMYRNICYYERNAGFESTFNSLIEVLISDVGLPIYEYQMFHDVEAISHISVTDTENLYPKALFKRKGINALAKTLPVQDYDLNKTLAILADSTPTNPAYQLYNQSKIEKSLDLSVNAQLSTKIIECALNPKSTPSQQTSDNVLFNHWVKYVANDKYAVPVEYTPIGAVSPVLLTHQQALAVWVYAISRALEPIVPSAQYARLTRVPPIQITHVIRDTIPTMAELLPLVDQRYMTKESVELLRSTAVQSPTSIRSLVEFTKHMQDVFDANTIQYNLYSFEKNPIGRGMAQVIADRFYADEMITLSEMRDPNDATKGLLYDTLLQGLGIDVSTYQPHDFYVMATSIYEYATGANAKALLDPSNIQTAMLHLLTYLSSYSLQIVASGESSDAINVPRPDVRAYDVISTEMPFHTNDNICIDTLEYGSAEVLAAFFSIPGPIYIARSTFNEQVSEKVDLFKHKSDRYVVPTHTEARQSISLEISSSFDAQAQFNALTVEQRNEIAELGSLV